MIEAPYGSHPFASHGFYTEDEDGIQEYVTASIAYRKRDMKAWNAYLEKWITNVPSHGDYLSKLSAARLSKLQNAVHA